jgi:phage-related protein
MAEFPTQTPQGKRVPNPSRPLQEGIAAQDLIFSSDSGHEQRRRKGLPICTFELSYVALTYDQYVTIRNFYINHTTAKAFDWYHPFTKQKYRVRFASDNLQGEYFEHPAVTGPLYKLSFALRQVL